MSVKNWSKEKRMLLVHGIILLAGLFLAWGFWMISGRIAENVPDQKQACVWGGDDYAQVSCYTSRIDAFTEEELMRFEYQLNEELKSADKETAAWTDAYSSKGRLTVSRGNTSVEGVVYGVGNDFFQFHPLTLLSGGYIDTENVMKDYILLDKESAWRLFGSVDVAGMTVDIAGDQFVVAGVYEQPQNRFHDAAGNGEITYYMSYETLQKYDETAVITCYEVMMENPVEHYAYDFVKKYFQPETDGTEGTSAATTEENKNRELSIVENTDRDSFSRSFAYLRNWGNNAMDTDEIVYPYWENVARAYDSLLASLLAVRLVCIAVAAVNLLLGIRLIYLIGNSSEFPIAINSQN